MTPPTTQRSPTKKIDYSVDDLLRMRKKYGSCRKVAREIGWSHEAVSNRLRGVITMKTTPNVDADKAARDWKKGQSVARIAHHLGVSRRAVRTNLRKQGWRVPKGGKVALRSLGGDIFAVLRGIIDSGDPARYYQQAWGLNLVEDAVIELGLVRQDRTGMLTATTEGKKMHRRHGADGELTETAMRDLRTLERKINQVSEGE